MLERLRRSLITLGVLGVAFYLGAAVWLRFNEKRIIYQPEVGSDVRVAGPSDPDWQRVTLTTADGVRLVGIVLPASDLDGFWLLDFHGNAGSVWSRLQHHAYDGFHALGLNVLAVDYRGYGESDSRPPDEAGLHADARACYDWLRRAREVPADRIVLYGHSLGSGPATELATRVPAAALVLEGAFTTVTERGAELYWWLPVRWLATQRFANVEKIGRVTIPKLLMHAIDDEVIPYAHGRRLFAAAHSPKQWADLSGGHNDARGAAWQAALGSFLGRLQPSRTLTPE